MVSVPSGAEVAFGGLAFQQWCHPIVRMVTPSTRRHAQYSFAFAAALQGSPPMRSWLLGILAIAALALLTYRPAANLAHRLDWDEIVIRMACAMDGPPVYCPRNTERSEELAATH